MDWRTKVIDRLARNLKAGHARLVAQKPQICGFLPSLARVENLVSSPLTNCHGFTL
ncbi:MAG: hypothetical protein HQL91_13440 [Magnetococcales bacterium]|nr:hypothetical protein [Magnetococcales bacterium]